MRSRAWAASPVSHLLIPRVLAGLLVIPALHHVRECNGYRVGYLTAKGSLGLTYGDSSTGRATFFRPLDLWYSAIKSGCFARHSRPSPATWASTRKQGAEGVGRATTTAVVAASGGDPDARRPDHEAAAGGEMIELIDVHNSASLENVVLDGVSLEVKDGEDPRAARALRSAEERHPKMINGLLRPDSGDVTVDGCTCRSWGAKSWPRCAPRSATCYSTARCSTR